MSESHPRITGKITVAVVVILATLAVISLLAYCFRKSRRNSGNGVSLKGSRSSRSSSLRLFPAANSGTKVGVSTSSDVLYLGTVNVVSPCQKNIDSPENGPEFRYSPEIRQRGERIERERNGEETSETSEMKPEREVGCGYPSYI
ncbi:hypothetical protein AMTRI_Chr08g164980 [Amborella trichopoda]